MHSELILQRIRGNFGRFRGERSKYIVAVRLFLGLIPVGLALQVCAQPIPSDPTAFTEYVAAAVRLQVGETAVSIREPLRLSIGELDGHLDRLLEYCRLNSTGCDGQVQQFAKAAAAIAQAKNAPIDEKAVQLVLRSDLYIQKTQTFFGVNGPQLQARSLVPGLMVVAVLDTPRAVRPLDERDLKKLGRSQEELFALAETNLANSLGPLSQTAKPVAAGQIGYLKPGFSEVGRVALAGQWATLAQAQGGELVIALPTTNQVLYVSESTPLARDALVTLSRKVASQSSNPLAPNTLLKWTAGHWETLK
jgi:hypothetical protein